MPQRNVFILRDVFAYGLIFHTTTFAFYPLGVFLLLTEWAFDDASAQQYGLKYGFTQGFVSATFVELILNFFIHAGCG